MKDQHEFDDLVRRKLAERGFPFQEEHWAEMEKLIPAPAGSRGSFAWWMIPLIGLILGGGIWSMMPGEKVGSTEVAVVDTELASIPANSPNTDLDEEHAVHQQDPQNVPANEVGGHNKAITPDHPYITTKSISSDEAANKDEWADPRNSPITGEAKAAHASMVEGRPTTEPTAESQGEYHGTSTLEQTSEPVTDHQLAEEGTVGSIYAPSSNSTGSIPKDASTADRPSFPPAEVENGSSRSTETSEDKEWEPLYVEEDTMSDTASTHNDPAFAVPSDTLFANDDTPLRTPLIMDPRSPLEISLRAGLLMTSAHYEGPLSMEWSQGVEGRAGYGGGLEVMRMGRHLGIGSGLHYTNYREHMTTSAAFRTDEHAHQYYYITTQDTTLLMITDTVLVNGQPYYVGQSVTTTLQVLQQGTETNVITTRTREARDRVNLTSYLEIPLLLDAHITQGPWRLGLRGGPTAGILTYKAGHLPSAEAGYLGFQDQQFRSIVLGYTARAYVLHEIAPGWWAGLEPMARGQLFNALESDQLSRKAFGWGGMIGIHYRLP